jgi:alcohol dehydrogenase (cytochrome c)
MGYSSTRKASRSKTASPARLNADAGTGDLWQTGGGSDLELGATYDPETNLLFAGTGNPAPWNSHLRPGDNLYSSSTVAIDAATGKSSPGTTRPRRTTAGTLTASTNSFPSTTTIRRPASRSRLGAKADRNGYLLRERPHQRQV